ncbi:enoyl-CoA hydratase EchA19-like isoform X2 [Babylonia areolata]|uniref:enoyl-CoA hydratase EchA19-like isoform X2 n=1 Tax=Babylonia areolata TaxID=304850 RepID=UPI003FD497AB
MTNHLVHMTVKMAALKSSRILLMKNINAIAQQNLRLSTSTCLSKDKDLVLVEQLGKVMTIGINRPEVRNCVNPATAQQLTKAFQQFEDTQEAHVAVLHGKGGCFCAGFDLKALSGGQVELEMYRDPEHSDSAAMGPTRKMFSKPVIAAVDGYGGLELALMCDLRVVEESAVMGVFCRRWGVPLLDGGTVRLPALIGLSRALDLVLTGRPVSAKEALEMGLANRVVATGTALGQAIQLANTVAQFPQQCMLADRASCYHSTFSAKSWKDAFQHEWTHGLKVLQSEAVPGATRFAQGAGRHGQFDNPTSKL